MIDIRLLRDNPDELRRRLLTRHSTGQAYAQLGEDINRLAVLDEERREALQASQHREQQRNELSKQIGMRKRAGEDAAELQEQVQQLKQELETHKRRLDEVEAEFNDLALRIPNVPDSTVPCGGSEQDNVEIRRVGDQPRFDFEPRQHFELGAELGILDLERAAKLSGARFSLLSGIGARLERALTTFMLDLHTKEHGYTEIAPPYIVSGDTMRGTGQLPKFAEDLFRLEHEKPMYLIPTAEVPLTNLHADEVLAEADLPRLYTAFTPCFRSEAGSYGKDTRGIMRVHQFDKVELVNVVAPETSNEALETMTRSAERVLQLLEIPYRVVVLCTADMGFAAAKTYDIEVWLPAQGCYREISSCSNCTDFQARRAGIRYKPAGGGKPQFVHTLNGSGLAVGRTWIALLENFQQADGSVVIPPVLRPYVDGCERITAP